MTVDEIIAELTALADEKFKKNVVKMGIPEKYSIGVSTGVLRRLAKRIGKANEVAFELWNTGYHEAKLLAVLLFEVKKLTDMDIENLMSDVISWDLCDHLCKNLISKRKDYDQFITTWIRSTQTYKKRAAFTLIATAVIHDKKISDVCLDDYLNLICEYSTDQQEHVKKAVSWALREIGKKDFTYNEKALLLAHELAEQGNTAQIWIAKDVKKELENIVRVEGRKRLISNNSKMGSSFKINE